MKKYYLILLITVLFLSNIYSQEVINSNETETKNIKGVEGVNAAGDKIIFNDGATPILEIENEGSTGSIMLPNVGAISL